MIDHSGRLSLSIKTIPFADEIVLYNFDSRMRKIKPNGFIFKISVHLFLFEMPPKEACSMAVPDMSTRPMTSALHMPSTCPAIRNTNPR